MNQTFQDSSRMLDLNYLKNCTHILEKYYKYLIVIPLFNLINLSKIVIFTRKRVNMKGLKNYEF